jgi:hypothetical protein
MDVITQIKHLHNVLQSNAVIWLLQVTRCQLRAVGHMLSTSNCNIRNDIMVRSFCNLFLIVSGVRFCSLIHKKEGPECCADPGPPLLGQVGGEILPRRRALGSPGLRPLFLQQKKAFISFHFVKSFVAN